MGVSDCRNPINRFNPATYLCLSLAKIWIYVMVFICIQWFEVRGERWEVGFFCWPSLFWFSLYFLFWPLCYLSFYNLYFLIITPLVYLTIFKFFFCWSICYTAHKTIFFWIIWTGQLTWLIEHGFNYQNSVKNKMEAYFTYFSLNKKSDGSFGQAS